MTQEDRQLIADFYGIRHHDQKSINGSDWNKLIPMIKGIRDGLPTLKEYQTAAYVEDLAENLNTALLNLDSAEVFKQIIEILKEFKIYNT